AILLDVQMPGMDGFETAAQIKERERSRHIPIIFLTAISREIHQQLHGYEVGAVDYISKPFDPWVLRAKVSVFVDLWSKTRQLQAQAELTRSRESARRAPGVGIDEATILLKSAAATDGAVARAHVEKAAEVLTR